MFIILMLANPYFYKPLTMDYQLKAINHRLWAVDHGLSTNK